MWHNKSKIFFLLIFVALTLSCGGGGNSAQTSTGSSDPLPPSTTGNVTLSWQAPIEYTDNSTLSNLAGFNIYMDDGSGYKRVARITEPTTTTHVINDLDTGQYLFVVTAFDDNGVESGYSTPSTFNVL